MKNKIGNEKLKKYFEITRKALAAAEKKVNKRSRQKKKQAETILDMARRYYDDALWFEQKKDFVNAFACLNYAHGWIDCGSKLGLFIVKDSRLFVLK